MSRSEFEPIFVRLREILRKHTGGLTVTSDGPDEYCISVEFSPKLGKGYPVAWIKIGKAYVSYHLMPVYMFPKLRDGLSQPLERRMQGKSCFNFKEINEGLFRELEQLTIRGFAESKKAGFA